MSSCLCGSEPRAESLSPNENRDVGVMHSQFADEAVVVMKRKADEDMVTYWRIKLFESTKDCKDEGWNMLRESKFMMSCHHEISWKEFASFMRTYTQLGANAN